MITRKTNGFTLVEILIVVIILGILAAIIIPQFTDASDMAKSSSVRSNLHALNSQFELYNAQHDSYPWDDGAGAIDTDANITARLTAKTDITGAAGGNLGPYMQSVPENSLAADGVALFGDTVGDCHWLVDVATGAVSDGTGLATN